jgi:TetR/AcrR family transcriptional repressor of nem operon
MRYEKGHKDTTHDHILEVAARRFRKDGIAASGLAGIMSEAGLTNGAFYAHFSSKSEMVEKCIERATDDQWQQFEKEIASGRLLDLIRAYLSEEHRDHPDSSRDFAPGTGHTARLYRECETALGCRRTAIVKYAERTQSARDRDRDHGPSHRNSAAGSRCRRSISL